MTRPPAEYYASLPKVIAGAAAVFHDEHHRILMVHTTYTDKLWVLPGGGLEEGEFPLDAARREVREELGADADLGQLLVVDWVPPQPDGRPALVSFVFDGGRVTEDWCRGIRLEQSELSEWRLTTAAERADLLIPRMAHRLDVCANLIANGTGAPAYLHEGRPG